jgi:agmatine deiminase
MTTAMSPASYRVPAEWEPQQCVWLSWPHNVATWPGRFPSIPGFYANWVRVIAESTPVRILASADVASGCEMLISGVRDVDVIDIPTNDCWIRDYGPTFVRARADQSVHGVDWQFNAWGGKYPPWDLDNSVPRKLCADRRLKCVAGQLCLEGGALEVDGCGRMLTTPTCLVTETRNPGWTSEQIAQELHRRLGVLEIVWLDGGSLVGDDTDGHIDQLARFIDCQSVVVAVCEDTGDENRGRLEVNCRQLELWADTTAPQVQIHRLPIPPPRYIAGQRVPESYCNFLRLGKERLLVPTFGARSDDHAVGLLREVSGAEVTAIDCRDLVWGLGALHCASRDQPA